MHFLRNSLGNVMCGAVAARDRRTSHFGIIPGKRPSSAFGYAQVTDPTWDWYKSKTNNKNASRANFKDVTDFIGWYVNQTNKMLGKILFSSIITFFILDINKPLESKAEKHNIKYSLINKFCIATLKSKLQKQNEKLSNEISNFTCECFSKKYRSGNSIKSSRAYCRNKASDKYNL